jgi:hypothetical protein
MPSAWSLIKPDISCRTMHIWRFSLNPMFFFLSSLIDTRPKAGRHESWLADSPTHRHVSQHIFVSSEQQQWSGYARKHAKIPPLEFQNSEVMWLGISVTWRNDICQRNFRREPFGSGIAFAFALGSGGIWSGSHTSTSSTDTEPRVEVDSHLH